MAKTINNRTLWLGGGAVLAAVVVWRIFSGGAGDFGPPQQGPANVSVVRVAAENIPVVTELPGRIAPLQVAEVRPKVSGVVVERVFQQGGVVQAGDVLYRIDPEPFSVRVKSAEASLRRAEAARVQAREQAERTRRLRDRKVASAQAYDDAVSASAQADAEAARARAELEAARIDLDNAEVKAPIAGRIGRALITEGALVSPADPQPLATINQLETVYADFTQSAGDLMRLRRAIAAGQVTSGGGDAAVTLIMDDGTHYGHRGRLLFSEAAVDAATGQVTLRGEFPNPDGYLLPGLFVRALVDQGVERGVIAVPQQAIQRDASGKAQVYVLDADRNATLRAVKIGRVVGDRRVVEEGLSAGDAVIVEGFQRIEPGAPVVAEDWAKAKRSEAAQTTPETTPETAVE